MNIDALKEQLQSLPTGIISFALAAYYGYSHYSFRNDETSDYVIKLTNIETIKAGLESDRLEIKKGNEFLNRLAATRDEIRKLTDQLGEMKATLSEEVDYPALLNLIHTESKKVGLNIYSLTPDATSTPTSAGEGQESFYNERRFSLSVKGSYSQIAYFFQRLSNVKRILRVEEFEITSDSLTEQSRPAGLNIISAKLGVFTYSYARSKADDVVKKQKETQAAPPSAGGKPQ